MEIEAGNGKDGLKTAVAELHDPNQLPGGEPAEQLQLPDLPLEAANTDSRAVAHRGRGRPPGAKNKNTEAWRDYLLTRYRSPLEALAQTFNLSVADLGSRLGLQNPPTFDQAVELFKLQMAAARDLAPYIHQKQPLALEGKGGGLIQLVLNTGAVDAQAGPAALAQGIQMLQPPIEENQLLTDSDFTDANESNSNESGQAHEE